MRTEEPSLTPIQTGGTEKPLSPEPFAAPEDMRTPEAPQSDVYTEPGRTATSRPTRPAKGERLVIMMDGRKLVADVMDDGTAYVLRRGENGITSVVRVDKADVLSILKAPR